MKLAAYQKPHVAAGTALSPLINVSTTEAKNPSLSFRKLVPILPNEPACFSYLPNFTLKI